jgi:hypothetical protein
MTRNLISVSIVCEGSRFMGLGDGKGFMEKLKKTDIPYGVYRNLKALCQANFASIFAKNVL